VTSPQEELAELERRLRAVRFEPRASLGAEIAGRAQRGEAPIVFRASRVRRILGITGICSLLAAGVVLATLSLLDRRAATVDRCCQDLDGGGSPDDGLMVTSAHGSDVDRLAIYEDRDGSGGYTPGDRIRFERKGTPALSGPLGAGVRTVEFCCVDYDGGGPSDDALMVVGRAPDLISMAAIYEHDVAPGELRRLR
jgi:hypothetical protein